MAVPDRGQRLHTEKEAIEKPTPAGTAGDTVVLQALKRREKKI